MLSEANGSSICLSTQSASKATSSLSDRDSRSSTEALLTHSISSSLDMQIIPSHGAAPRKSSGKYSGDSESKWLDRNLSIIIFFAIFGEISFEKFFEFYFK